MNPTSRFQKILAYAKAHKVLGGIVLVVVVYAGYRYYQSATSTTGETRYVVTTVAKETIVSSISGSGQVSTSDQIDLKPKASGDITWVGVKAGDFVSAGQAIAQIDATTAKQSVATEEQTLVQAKLQLQKDTAQAPIDYQKLQETLANAKTDLANTYNDTYNTLSTAFLDLPATVTGMQNTLYGYDLNPSRSQWNIDVLRNLFSSPDASGVFADVAARDYTTARTKYDAAIVKYKALSRYSSSADLEAQLTTSVDTTTAIAQALQSELNLLDAIVQDAQTYNHNVSPVVNTLRNSTRNYLATVNSDLSSMLSQQKTLNNTKQAIVDDQHNIDIASIANPTGGDPISLQSEKNNIAQQELSLQQAKDNLANYTISAPFSGTVAVLNVNTYDSVSTGTAVATLITSQKIAEISLNEIDAAKIKVGQKATLTFDAIDGLTIAGDVASIDTVGTVSQGVVTYKVQIVFKTQDDRVKSGMSVSAAIVTAVKQDVLAVPSSGVKGQGNTSYVEVFDIPLVAAPGVPTSANAGLPSATLPLQQAVVVGIANDTTTEIISGLTEGQQVVTRTIAGTAATATQAPSILNAAGVRTGGGGAVRGATGR
jgi:RND family efflux transporter MFP subunit